MIQKMIDRIYGDADFTTRKKAQHLTVFSLILMCFLPIIALSSLFGDSRTVMNTMVSLVVVFAGAAASLTLLRMKKYTAASYVMITTITMALVGIIATARHDVGFKDTYLYLYGLLVLAVFFGGRLAASVVAAISLSVSVLFFFLHRGTGENTQGIISFVISFILTYILAMLLVNTLQKAFAQSQEATERSQALLDSNNRLLDEVRGQISSLISISGEVADTSGSISQGAQKQAAGIEEIASSLEEMNAMVSANADNAVTVARMSKESLDLAEQGGTVVREAITSINNINAMSGRIQDILAIINDIAFQTNLLALNAAVEAARAGEHGRGFAVVAGEVRNLAQRSGNSAKEIESLIKDSIMKIAQGTELVNQSGEALDKIIGSSKETKRIITEVSSSLDEQKHGIEQVNRAVAEIDELTQVNASAAEQLSASAENLNSNTEQLEQVVRETGGHAGPALVQPVRPVRRDGAQLRAAS